MKTPVKTCHAFEVGGDAPAGSFYVEAFLQDGRTAYHEGPTGYAFFTEQQAAKLANDVFLAGSINTEHWLSARGRPLRQL